MPVPSRITEYTLVLLHTLTLLCLFVSRGSEGVFRGGQGGRPALLLHRILLRCSERLLPHLLPDPPIGALTENAVPPSAKQASIWGSAKEIQMLTQQNRAAARQPT
jgi:hypothetical protein